MISTSFLKVCKELIFAKKKKVLNATVYQNIGYYLNYAETFYKKTAPGDVPILIRNEVDLIKMACRTLLNGGSLSDVLISIDHSEKYRQYADQIHYIGEVVLQEKDIDDRLRIVGRMVALMRMNSNLVQWEDHLSRIKSGATESIEETISLYSELVKSSFRDVMDCETKLNLGLVRSLNTVDDSFIDVIAEIKKKYSRQNVIPSGIPELDKDFLFGGFQPSRLYMFGGTSGVGKSILLLNCAERGALSSQIESFDLDPFSESKSPKGVFLYITLENYVYESWMRLYCSLLIKTKAELLSDISGEDSAAAPRIKEIFQKMFLLHNSSIQIEYFPPNSISPINIAALIQKYNQNPNSRKVKAVYVDYLDLLKPDQSRDLYRLDLGEITSGLKTIATSFEIPIITATQLNREAYRQERGKEKGMETISESIQKLFIADFGGIIRKDDVDPGEDNQNQGPKPVKVTLSVEKNRDGKVGKVQLYLDYQRSRFLTNEEYQKEFEKRMQI